VGWATRNSLRLPLQPGGRPVGEPVCTVRPGGRQDAVVGVSSTTAPVEIWRPPADPRHERESFRPFDRLFETADIASLVHVRIAFGAIMLWEVLRYFTSGWIGRYYVNPTYHFAYFGFEWVQPWPGSGMYLHFWALAALAISIMLGFQYRVTTALFFLGFTYVFLLDQARYLNHFYLVSLLGLLLIIVPAHRAVSIDAWRRPSARSETAPTWALWLLRAQIGIVYIYGGVAKLNEDWLRGEPLRTWLADYADWKVVGPFLTSEWAVYLFSYGGLLFDLLIVPLLLWKRTRRYAFAGVVAFNVLNGWLFNIGIFPWLMIAASLLFFAPDWPRRWRFGVSKVLGGSVAVNAQTGRGRESPVPSRAPRLARVATLGLLAGYLGVQVLVPFRHYLYPGNVHWSEEGHRFSWHMKLRDKNATARFLATDPSGGRTWQVDPRAYLAAWQIQEMVTRPDMILQFSHHLANDLRKQGYGNIEIRADVMASLNGRPAQRLIDPAADLAAQPRSLLPAAWILPLG
jgi:hypothetical protein